MRKKEAIILSHNGGQLANQLWNHLSIYAYCLDRGYVCKNYCFFEYASSFSFPVGNALIDLLFFRTFPFGERLFGFAYTKKIWRRLYRVVTIIQEMVRPRSLIRSRTTADSLGTYLLPPSALPTTELARLEASIRPILFDGWLFRNPAGIRSYRAELIAAFQPKREIQERVANFLRPLRASSAHIVGVHIRQGDYREFKQGRFFIDQKRVREILDEYLARFSLSKDGVCFVICTNGDVDVEAFSGLDVRRTGLGSIEELFVLAACDLIIGSDSTFGSFASYYGNIPHIVFKNEAMDWAYYQDKKQYFQNKYCLTVCDDPTLWSGR